MIDAVKPRYSDAGTIVYLFESKQIINMINESPIIRIVPGINFYKFSTFFRLFPILNTY